MSNRADQSHGSMIIPVTEQKGVFKVDYDAPFDLAQPSRNLMMPEMMKNN